MLKPLRAKFIGCLAHCDEHIYDRQPFTARLAPNEVYSLGNVLYQSARAGLKEATQC